MSYIVSPLFLFCPSKVPMSKTCIDKVYSCVYWVILYLRAHFDGWKWDDRIELNNMMLSFCSIKMRDTWNEIQHENLFTMDILHKNMSSLVCSRIWVCHISILKLPSPSNKWTNFENPRIKIVNEIMWPPFYDHLYVLNRTPRWSYFLRSLTLYNFK